MDGQTRLDDARMSVPQEATLAKDGFGANISAMWTRQERDFSMCSWLAWKLSGHGTVSEGALSSRGIIEYGRGAGGAFMAGGCVCDKTE